MYAAPTESYHAPGSLSDALALLTARPDRTRVLAGGQSAVPLLRARQDRPAVLLDLRNVPGLRDLIFDAGSALRVGALVRCAELALADLGPGREALADAARGIGDRQVRNRGTLGGNLAHADVTGDMAPVGAALDAVVHLVSSRGTREVPVEEFVAAPRRSALEPGELISHVVFPEMGTCAASAYLKYGITYNGRAVIGAAVAVQLAEDGSCRRARIVVGGIPPAPARSSAAEAAVVGSRLHPAAIASAAAAAADEVPTHSDGRASREYRTQLVRVYVRRALEQASSRATTRS